MTRCMRSGYLVRSLSLDCVCVSQATGATLSKFLRIGLLSEIPHDGSYTLAFRSFLAPVFRPHSQGKAVLPEPGLLIN